MKIITNWLLATATILLVSPLVKADEGMWMVQFLKQQNLAKMQAMGMQMSAEDIYNPGQGSLVDAVVQFGGGCTGEIVSGQGLVITNHHCGFGEIQNHSSVDHNYLRDGFYAPTLQTELPNPGLTVTIVEEIIDATEYLNSYIATKGITDPLQYMRRAFLLQVAQEWYKEHRGELSSSVDLDMAPFYEGNRYYLFVKKIYSDVRLVAAPPSCIGKFGADTDNWAWPRHSGDFSIFRIYTAPDGSPAEYAAENIPLKPKYYLKINSTGVQEGDFVMMMGFPGTTNHFYTPSEVVERRNIDNQIRIDLRKVRQETMWEEMMKDEAVNIQYADKYQGSTNAYKNAIGTNWATDKMNFVGNKQAMVDKLRAYAEKQGKPEYAEAIDKIESIVRERATLRALSKIYDEGLYRAVETVRAPILTEREFESATNEPRKFLDRLDGYFNKDYNVAVDKKVTKAMLHAVIEYIQKILGDNLPPEDLTVPPMAMNLLGDEVLDKAFDNSLYQNREKLQQVLNSGVYSDYSSDPLIAFAIATRNDIATISNALSQYDRDFAIARQTMLRGILEMEGEMNLWPDANLTLRYTYGKVKGYSPRDNVFYGHQTTMEGIMEKWDDSSPEFYLLPKVVEIYNAQDFGALTLYNGKMPVNFISTTHSTGGNSGSPLVNSRGELIGINFDRNWEGVGGDIQYLPDYQRSIILDVRYLLLVLDKYLGAERLLDELDIVK